MKNKKRKNDIIIRLGLPYSRLGEMKQGARLRFLRETSPGRLAQLLSEQATRPSERDLA